MSEWGERYLNDSMSSSISLPFLVHIYCSGWKYWRGGGEILHSTPHVITNVSFTKRGKRESIRYVGGRRRFQNTFQIARLTNSLFRPRRRREERRINIQPGRASVFFFYYTALHREASPFFFSDSPFFTNRKVCCWNCQLKELCHKWGLTHLSAVDNEAVGSAEGLHRTFGQREPYEMQKPQ